MKPILFALLFVTLITGCQDKEAQAKHDAVVAQKARTELLAQLEAQKREKEEKKTIHLSSFGIQSEDGKIIIDTNQTKKFFKDIAQKLHTKITKVSKELHQGHIQEKEAGIEVSKTSISIDLNKTKSFLEGFARKMEKFAKEFDTITDNLETSTEGK
jgi:thiamine kinase-like enzyme